MEEEFAGSDGLEILPSGSPFYLVKAGSDLYFKTRPKARKPAKFTKLIEDHEKSKAADGSHRDSIIDPGSSAPSSGLTSLVSSPANTPNRAENHGSESETSKLSVQLLFMPYSSKRRSS